MLATVGGKTLPITMVMFKQFGDPFHHEPRTCSTTLTQLSVARSKVNPIDIKAFFREAQHFRLNGVHEPFWGDYPLVCPSSFLTPEFLHLLHRESWDHNVKWCINVIGTAEIHFRFSILQPIVGFQHYKSGITRLKWVTGHIHCDVQHYIVGMISGPSPTRFMTAIRALMDFRYRVQSRQIDDGDIAVISDALSKFHANKDVILQLGARCGEGQKNPIDHWQIPKLEIMQSIIPSIRWSGVPIQWTVDVTEHTHITEIKVPAESSNNNNYEPQICRYLDRAEKCRSFEFVTSFLGQHAPESPPSEINSEAFSNMDPDSDLDSPVENEFEPQALGTDVTPVAPGYAHLSPIISPSPLSFVWRRHV